MKGKLDAIGLVTNDMPRTLAFYRRLGLDIPPEADAETHASATLGGGVQLMWDTVEMVRSFDTGWTPPSGGHRMSLAVGYGTPTEVDAAYADLTGAGYIGHHEPWDAPWGMRYATVFDPDDNPVDLYADLPSAEG